MKKYILHGIYHRENGWEMRHALSYLTETKEDAIAICNRLNPRFVVNNVTVED